MIAGDRERILPVKTGVVHGRLTNRSSGRVIDKVPSSYVGARAAQLNR